METEFHTKDYLSYQDVLKDSKSYKIKDNIIDANKNFNVIGPKITNIFTHLESLKEYKRRITKDLYLIHDRLVNSLEIDIDEIETKFSRPYNNIIRKINQTESEMQKLEEYYRHVNKESNEHLLQIQSNIQQVREERKKEINQPLDTEKNIKLHKKEHGLFKELAHAKRKAENRIEFFIDTQPILLASSHEKPAKGRKKKAESYEKPIKGRKKKVESHEKPEKKAALRLSPKELNVIDENIKQLIKDKFPFATQEECISKKKIHFMSKDDIVTQIEKHGALKRRFPSNVDIRKLKKEDICEYLFQN